jgi:hypothetical protein
LLYSAKYFYVFFYPPHSSSGNGLMMAAFL